MLQRSQHTSKMTLLHVNVPRLKQPYTRDSDSTGRGGRRRPTPAGR